MSVTYTIDMVLAAPLIAAAEALGFPSDLGPLALFELGGALNSDDSLWEIIERNWQLECKSPGVLADPRTIELETIRSLPEFEKCLYRNKAISRRNAERALNTVSKD